MTTENGNHEIDSRVLAKAVEVFGFEGDAELWLRGPAMALDGRRPLDMLKSPEGARQVCDCLERLQHGVYI